MNWKTLKQFNQLFEEGESTNDLLETSLGRRILEMEFVVPASKRTIQKTNLYDAFYSESILPKFNSFKTLIDKYNLADTNFEESVLRALVKIENDKEQILDTGKSQKEIATHYFDDAKYLKRGSRLYDAVLGVLGIDILAVDEHDQQFLWVLHSKIKKPKAIILCENDNQVRKPRLNEVELWYAGGRNTAKLKFVNEPIIPFYYLCDWDNKGIEIYHDIKKNIFPDIEILVPQEPIKLNDIESVWKTQIDFSIFSENAKYLLNKLIPEKWIEEESINHYLLNR